MVHEREREINQSLEKELTRAYMVFLALLIPQNLEPYLHLLEPEMQPEKN